MSIPAYHLRMNKMVERLLFVELLHRLDGLLPVRIEQHTYVGLGGPYLEDFNLIHATFAIRKMISLEIHNWILTRQRINCPHSAVEITATSTMTFVEEFEPTGESFIVWFDHSRPDWAQQISECCNLLQKLPPMSILKITFSGLAKRETLDETATKLNETFTDFGPFEARDVHSDNICETLYSILQKSIALAMPDTPDKSVRSLASYRYDDGTPILTVTMIVGPIKEIEGLIRKAGLKGWHFADIGWKGTRQIDVPSLGIREKLAIDQLLPGADAGVVLTTLGLRLEKRSKDSRRQMANYLQFYRQVPQFLRVSL
jgi:hypothetical protein